MHRRGGVPLQPENRRDVGYFELQTKMQQTGYLLAGHFLVAGILS
jgi:hypothetical protein